MISRVQSGAVLGIDGYAVEVEVNLAMGIPGMSLVGSINPFDEFAAFQLDIKNNLDKKDEYRIYTLDFPTWDVRTEPIVNPITLELGPREEGSVELVVDPLKIRDIGTYQVNVNVRSKLTNKVVSVPMKVTILSTESLLSSTL